MLDLPETEGDALREEREAELRTLPHINADAVEIDIEAEQQHVKRWLNFPNIQTQPDHGAEFYL